ncbi:hypothetical protein TRICHSKD4_3702 [Roseibium sp. TrichSKD4]|uniref:hypothetical protein n=1 Tax=Roseibium sp. TrichSKD4 TaxID=744980 RepID=UPI0001E56B53|nr:hypothetical protein [Roseibium sp. TrichSKD4]EFO30127.1 hypothetical protein TRICHSKD4_3702 [Roseibium sp. TrichSKD4]
MTRYAGLDVSKTCTGWGLITPEGISSGTMRCKIKRPFELPAGKIDAAYAGKVGDWYQRELDAWLVKHKPDTIAIEQPQPGSLERTKTEINHATMFAGEAKKKVKVGGTSFEVTHFLISLAFLMSTVCIRRGLQPVYVPSNEWRGTVGIGKPPHTVEAKNRRDWYKKKARETALARGHETKSGDAAEALCIALHLKLQAEPEGTLFSAVS